MRKIGFILVRSFQIGNVLTNVFMHFFTVPIDLHSLICFGARFHSIPTLNIQMKPTTQRFLYPANKTVYYK